MDVAIRTDASVQAGTGHVMRCLTLAEGLRQRGARVTFICRELPGNLCDVVADRHFPVARMPLPGYENDRAVDGVSQSGPYTDWLGASFARDAQETRDAIRELGGRVEWLIVDHYALGEEWERSLRPEAAHIMAIDDLANRRHDCDVLLDQNLCSGYRTRYGSLIPPHAMQLLGPRFALLRPEFHRARSQPARERQTVNRVLLFFGGADPDNATEQVLRAILALNRPEITVDVVVGKAYCGMGRLESLCHSRAGVAIHRQISNIAELMVAADLFIGASGATTWERMALTLPSIVITIADNQTPIAEYLGRRGLIRYLGRLTDFRGGADCDRQLTKALSSAIDSFPALVRGAGRGARLVDALGVDRALDSLQSP